MNPAYRNTVSLEAAVVNPAYRNTVFLEMAVVNPAYLYRNTVNLEIAVVNPALQEHSKFGVNPAYRVYTVSLALETAVINTACRNTVSLETAVSTYACKSL